MLVYGALAASYSFQSVCRKSSREIRSPLEFQKDFQKRRKARLRGGQMAFSALLSKRYRGPSALTVISGALIR